MKEKKVLKGLFLNGLCAGDDWEDMKQDEINEC